MPTIPRLRLRHQQILATQLTTPRAIVGHLGAMQAQDYAMAKWGVALRLPGTTDAAVEAAIDAGHIIRTHLLRPTWHFVAAEDLRWLLALTAPHIASLMQGTRRQLGLDDAVLLRSNDIIARALSGGDHLTREELMTELAQAGLPIGEYRSAHLMFHAELEGLVCNGSRRGKQFTYALVEHKVGPGPTFTREEALVALARRYFRSHGPATEQDFSWWSGLNLTAVRAGLAGAQADLLHEKIAGRTYWFPDTGPAPAPDPTTVHLLPAFDEFMVSYRDRTASLDPAYSSMSITSNGIFKPIIVVDGQVLGLWKRTVKKDRVELECQYFDAGKQADLAALSAAAERFGNYLGLPVKLN